VGLAFPCGCWRSDPQGTRESHLEVDHVGPIGRHPDPRDLLTPIGHHAPDLANPRIALLAPELALRRSDVLPGDIIEHLNGREATKIKDAAALTTTARVGSPTAIT
jgi:hypothetical protein